MHYNIESKMFIKFHLNKLNYIYTFKILIHLFDEMNKRNLVPFNWFDTVKNMKTMDILMEYF